MRFDEATGSFGVFRQPANFSNGLARDRQGRLLACEHLTRRITRTEYDGRRHLVTDELNGPNGLAFSPERRANLAFGGPKKNRLFMASCHSLYALYVETHGAA